jgi:biotin-(acetyl-CoA carboxylase) ligase
MTANSTGAAARPLDLPPLFMLRHALDDAFEAACAGAAEGADPATLYWTPRRDKVDLAVVLMPELPRAACPLTAILGLAALGDALAAVAPPNAPLTFGWPDRMLVDGATAGGVRLALAPGAVPDWLVLGVRLDVTAPMSAEADPGHDLARTWLHEEGFGDVAVEDVVDAFARHFQSWVDRWSEDGFAPAIARWRQDAREAPADLDRVDLLAAFAQPSWR